ncbi:hypothetical protein RQP46_006534 [Phenoliferia psychrophenolica]
MPTFAKIATAVLVGLLAFAEGAGEARRHLAARVAAHGGGSETRFVRTKKSGSRMDSISDWVDRRAVPAEGANHEKRWGLPFYQNIAPLLPPVIAPVAAVVAPVVAPIKPVVAPVAAPVVAAVKNIVQAIDLLGDKFNCGAIGLVCPHSYTGRGTPACSQGHCTLTCPSGLKLKVDILGGTVLYC